MSEVVVGQPVPAFTANSTDGEIQLSDLRGQSVVLYFYPKDNTPGCTTQAQGFRDAYPDFTRLGCRIIGVSRDSIRTHEGFIARQGLPFALISDPDESLCNLFGVMKMKKLYGKEFRGIERSTFLIDGEGVLRQE